MTTSSFEEWKLVFLSPWGSVGLILAGIGFLLALVLTALGYRRKHAFSVRILLIFLRILTLSSLLTLLLQPAIQLRNVTRIPNHVAVLIDTSQSMAVRQTASGATRLDRATAMLKGSQARLAAWKQQRALENYSFGADVKVLDQGYDHLKAEQPATWIRQALSKVKTMYRDRDLGGVILISDGIDNGRFGQRRLGQSDRRFLRELKAPVHTIWIGEPAIRDIAIAEVFADAFAFVRNAVPVDVEVNVHGFVDETIPVTLEMGGKVIARRQIKVKRHRSRYRVHFEFVPERVGKYVYTVAVPVFSGEALSNNNQRSFILKVIRDRIRVLQVCGRPSWDERFLRHLLKRDPNIDLISFFILRTPTDLSMVPTEELSLIPFPTEELFEKELGSFDLILLQDFNYKPYNIGMYLPHIRRFVEQGGGLAMIGGSLSFSSGDYNGTPVAEILPVRLLPNSAAESRLISTEEFRPVITKEGREHPIMQIGRTRQETTQLLTALPPLNGVNLVAGAKRGATVLATHPSLKTSRGEPMPVLTAWQIQSGRALALTTDSSWNWAFHYGGSGGTPQAYDRFWRNTIRWLIQDPDLKYLRVILNQDTVRLKTPVKAVIRAYNPDYSPAKGLKVSYAFHPLKEEGGKTIERQTNQDGEIHIELSPERLGAYKLTAEADIGGRHNTEEALVLVESAGPEEKEPKASPVLLRRISDITGGKHYENVPSLPELDFNQPRLLRVNWRRDFELWNRPWMLLICVGLMGLEWFLRRRLGYL